MIGLFVADAEGARSAELVASALGPDAAVLDGPVGAAARNAWSTVDAAVFFLGTGATMRVVRDLLADDAPAIVCAENGSDHVISLLGGFSAGGNAITERVAHTLGREPVFAVGPDDVGTNPLDLLAEKLDARLDGPVADCAAAIAAGEPILLLNPIGADVDELPAQFDPAAKDTQWTVVIDDHLPTKPLPGKVVRVIPRTLVVGIGSSSGVDKDRIAEVIARVGAGEHLDLRAVKAFATLAGKADEPGVRAALEDHAFWCDEPDLAVLTYRSEELAAVAVPNPSAGVEAKTGTPSVAEAAALLAARQWDPDAVLTVPKTTAPNVTLAVVRLGRWQR